MRGYISCFDFLMGHCTVVTHEKDKIMAKSNSDSEARPKVSCSPSVGQVRL